MSLTQIGELFIDVEDKVLMVEKDTQIFQYVIVGIPLDGARFNELSDTADAFLDHLSRELIGKRYKITGREKHDFGQEVRYIGVYGTGTPADLEKLKVDVLAARDNFVAGVTSRTSSPPQLQQQVQRAHTCGRPLTKCPECEAEQVYCEYHREAVPHKNCSLGLPRPPPAQLQQQLQRAHTCGRPLTKCPRCETEQVYCEYHGEAVPHVCRPR
jgi:hypothetical protein